MDGCPLGEISTTTSLIEEGDRDGWYLQWTATAERVAGYADESARAGHIISASDAYLRASSYYRAAYLPLYGSPVDPRLVEAFDKEASAFQKAAALMTSPVEPVEIPFEETTLPGYFCRVDDSDRSRSTLICTNGYDSTIYEMYLDFGTALRRGYNLLLFDGPGQGRPLIEQRLVMRPDWENVVRPVVDYALTRPEVDPEVLEPIVEHIQKTPALRWAIIQRAFWVHGIDSLSEYLKLAEDYSLKEAVSQIRCPTLLTWAESDPLSWNAKLIYDQLRSQKELVRFYDAEGAGEHCEVKTRSLFHQRAFDWLDEALAAQVS